MRIIVLALVLALVLAACGKSSSIGNWQASRRDFCDQLPARHQDFETAFGGAAALSQTLENGGAILPACYQALEYLGEARGLLAGLEASEHALYAGAPDTTADRAMFVTAGAAQTVLLQVGADQVALLKACAHDEQPYVRGWLDKIDVARKAIDARFDQQIADCTAAGASSKP
jgi:hypothetical protein